ncbi:hypothetical protein CI238_02022, partial [Colletotrichum incanum]
LVNLALPAGAGREQWQTIAKAPAQLVALDLLGNLDLAVDGHLVSSVEEGHHEVEVEAVLRATLELLERARNAGKQVPRFLAAAHGVGKVVHLAEGEGVGHAKGLGTVVEVGEDVDILAAKGLGQRGLVDTVEGAGSELAALILLQDLLGEVAALSGGGLRGAGHVKGHRLAKRVVVVQLNLDLSDHAGSDARMDNGLLDPAVVRLLALKDLLDQRLVNGLAGAHQAVSEMGVLVKLELLSAEGEVILVVALRELFRHASVRSSLEGGLEDNLGRTAAEIEDGSSGALVGAANLAEEVVGRDPGIDTLVGAVHDGNSILLLGDNGEGVLGLETVADGRENLFGILSSDHAEPSRRFHCNRATRFELLGNCLHGDLH